MRYAILECENPECRLRLPHTERDRALRSCPRCGAPITVVGWHTLANDESRAADSRSRLATEPIDLLLDNLRSAFNVGSILRSADAAGVRRVFLCGITPTPANPAVTRASLGAEMGLSWNYAPNGLETARALRAEGVRLWALEEGERSTSLFDASLPDGFVALVAGNEVTGVEPALLDVCEKVVSLPMRGRKRSLNVAVAVGAALVIMGERWSRAYQSRSANQFTDR